MLKGKKLKMLKNSYLIITVTLKCPCNTKMFTTCINV